MLSGVVSLIAPAAAGLGALPAGAALAPTAGLFGLVAAAAFVALLGAFAAPPAEVEPERPEDGWTTALRRPVAALCAAVFGVVGALCGGLAWQVWELQGPGNALGLSAAALAFLTASASFAGRALRRR